MPADTVGSAALDKDGFLKNARDWTRDVAMALAEDEGIVLDDRHWEVIGLLQSFYERFESSPANRALVKYVRQELGPDKGNSLYLMQLFPGSPAKLGSRIAGLPKPDNCL